MDKHGCSGKIVPGKPFKDMDPMVISEGSMVYMPYIEPYVHPEYSPTIHCAGSSSEPFLLRALTPIYTIV